MQVRKREGSFFKPGGWFHRDRANARCCATKGEAPTVEGGEKVQVGETESRKRTAIQRDFRGLRRGIFGSGLL